MKKSHFIWSVKGKIIETEEAHNVTYRQIEQKKLRLAVKHGCSFSDVAMVYEIEEEGKHG